MGKFFYKVESIDTEVKGKQSCGEKVQKWEVRRYI